MPSERLVECQDCGYRWESGAANPRCSKSDCGRSRNVEPVEDTVEDEGDTEADESEQQPAETVEEDEADPDPDDADDGDSEGYTPAFETQNVRADAERGDPGSSTDEDDDEDDGSSSTSTDEDGDDEPEPEGVDEVPELDPEQLKPAIDATFKMIAVNRGQHWTLDDDEAEQLAEGWTPVMNHYAPVLLKENALLVTAAITSYGVLAPRLAKDRELAQQAERDSVDDEADAGSVRQAVVEDTVEDEQTDEQTASSNGAAPGGYASV